MQFFLNQFKQLLLSCRPVCFACCPKVCDRVLRPLKHALCGCCTKKRPATTTSGADQEPPAKKSCWSSLCCCGGSNPSNPEGEEGEKQSCWSCKKKVGLFDYNNLDCT